MEAGAHSPWISRYLEGLGWEVIVSNPRKEQAIYKHERKCAQRDALRLARIGRMDRALLYPRCATRARVRNRIGCGSSYARAWCEREYH